MIHAPLATLFAAAFYALAFGQVPAKPEPVIAPEHAGLRIELAAPEQPVHVWAASEWTLTFHNGSTTGLPFDADLLTPRRYDDAGVHFEVVQGETTKLVISNNRESSPFCGKRKYDHLEPGHDARLPVILHGDMVYDQTVGARGERPFRFVPVFEAAGTHMVTAVLTWGSSAIRSAPVVIEVRAAPAGSEGARADLERMAGTGICLDVQYAGLWGRKSRLEEIHEFVERHPYTLYGAQLRVGLAASLLGMTDPYDPATEQETEAALARVRSLLAHEPPCDFGLQRSWARLRADLAEADRIHRER